MDFRAVATALLLLLWTAMAQKQDMVWPKNKVTYSDSFLPAVVQVLSYLMERIDGVDAAPKVTEGEAEGDGEEGASSRMWTPKKTTDTEESEGSVGVNSGHELPHLAAQDLRPTVAFILLGRLRDTLAHEAKRQGFSRIQGFSGAVVDALAASSAVPEGGGGSLSQLRALLGLMLRNNDIKRRDSLAQSGLIVDHLDKQSGPLQKALADVPPLKYTDIKRRDSLAQSGLIVDHLDKQSGPLQKALADVPPLKYTDIGHRTLPTV